MRGPLLTALTLLLLASPALPQVLTREGGFGDRIQGDVHLDTEMDMYTDAAVEGSRLALTILPRGKTPYRSAIVLLPEGEDDLDANLLQGKLARLRKGGAGFAFQPFLLPSTGRYRLLVFAGTDEDLHPAPGDYLLRTRVRPPRKLTAEGSFPVGGGEDEVPFSAFVGTVATVKVKAAGGAARPDVADLLDPDGRSILSLAEPREKRSGWILRQVPLDTFGRYRLLVSSTEPGGYVVKVKLRPPRRRPGKIDNTDAEPPEPDPVALGVTSGGDFEPIVLVEGEEGGANSLLSFPKSPVPGLSILDAGPVTCGAPEDEEYDGEGRHTAFTIRCSGDAGDYVAIVTGIEREVGGDRIVGYRVGAETPAGSGSSEFSGVTRDAEGRVTGWTERRTYDGSGRAYSVVVRDVRRRENGRTRSFVADLTLLDPIGGDTPLGSFPYPAWALPAE